MDLLLALITFGFVFYFLVWKDFLEPLLGQGQRAQTVKRSSPLPPVRRRSRVRNAPNAPNAGSEHQRAEKASANVPQNVPGSGPVESPAAATAAAAGAVLMSANELQQLAESIAARATGATIEEAIYRGFGLKKGGGPAYRRARELFDTATAPPSPKQ